MGNTVVEENVEEIIIVVEEVGWGDNTYVYIGYASDDLGADFSLIPTDNLKYRAEITSTEELNPPTGGDFAGAIWVKYIGDDGANGKDGTDGRDGTGVPVDQDITQNSNNAARSGAVYPILTDVNTLNKVKLDKVAGVNLFNKDATIEVFEVGDSHQVDIFQDNILQKAWSTGYNYETYGLVYQDNDLSVSHPILLSEDNPNAVANQEVSGVTRVFYFDSSARILQIASNTVQATWFAGVSYVRFTTVTDNIDTWQIEYGTVATPYKPFTDYGFVESIENRIPSRVIEAILPSRLAMLADTPTRIYTENSLLKQLKTPANLLFEYGANYQRLSSIHIVSSGTYNWAVDVISNLKKANPKQIELEVVDPSLDSGKSPKILYIGDSFTDIADFIKGNKALLSNNGVTQIEVGTLGDSTATHEGLSGGTLANTFLDSSLGVARIVSVSGVTELPQTNFNGIFEDKVSGTVYLDDNGNEWQIRSRNYSKMSVTKQGATNDDFSSFPSSGNLTKKAGQDDREGDNVIAYTSVSSAFYNPFINPAGSLDIANYLSVWGLQTPDIVVMQFTWNDLPTWATELELNTVVGNFITAVDHVKTNLPSAKIILSIEPMGSYSSGISKDFNGKKYSVLLFAEKMIAEFEKAEYSDYVSIAPAYAFVDLELGYSPSDVTPNPRYTEVERSGGDGVHPSTDGMEQISECQVPIIHSVI